MDWQKLISELIDSGMTQSEIAEAAGTKQASISDIYRGVTQDPRSSTGIALIDLAKKRKVPSLSSSKRKATPLLELSKVIV